MPPHHQVDNLIFYRGANYLKHRLILATLSGKSVQISNIRSIGTEPGLGGHELSLIRLFDKITNGSVIELNESGTSLIYHPGVLNGGRIEHNCCPERGISYYLDILIAMGPFCKNPLNVSLYGVTNSKDAPSVDAMRSTAMSILKKFMISDDGLILKTVKRGLMPDGGGEVLFKCPVRKLIKEIQLDDPGLVKRIRGTVYTCKVSPLMAHRTIESAKAVLLCYLPDVYIQNDHNGGKHCGKSPGFGIHLVAETIHGTFYSSDTVSSQYDTSEATPEYVGLMCALNLLEQIYRGGCVDTNFQWLVLLYMSLGQKGVSKYQFGPLTQPTLNFMQYLRDFFAINFNVTNCDPDDQDPVSPTVMKVLLSCVGLGYNNFVKPSV